MQESGTSEKSFLHGVQLRDKPEAPFDFLSIWLLAYPQISKTLQNQEKKRNRKVVPKPICSQQDALTNAMQALSDANVRLNESMAAQEGESETRKARLELLEKFISL